MNYDHHTPQQSADYCRQALAIMASRQIAPTPANFTVWYCYASGEWPSLSNALDFLIASGGQFTPQRNSAVHAKFFATPYEPLPLHSMAERMMSELATVLGLVEQASRSTAEYGNFLETTSDEVTPAQEGDGVRQILGRLLSETRAMSLQSLEVERRLRVSSSEVAKLKADLDEARREALVDPLTGLGNRKMFNCVLRKAAIAAMESREPLSLLLLDVDHFKKFNDEFGHQIGDQVLKVVAVMLRENIKGQDTAARYGGEEFAIVLPQTAGRDARKLAENIRQKICQKRLVVRKTGKHVGTLTISSGVAEFTFIEPLSEFFGRADRALYRAKQTGRNRVVVADSADNHVPMPT